MVGFMTMTKRTVRELRRRMDTLSKNEEDLRERLAKLEGSLDGFLADRRDALRLSLVASVITIVGGLRVFVMDIWTWSRPRQRHDVPIRGGTPHEVQGGGEPRTAHVSVQVRAGAPRVSISAVVQRRRDNVWEDVA